MAGRRSPTESMPGCERSADRVRLGLDRVRAAVGEIDPAFLDTAALPCAPLGRALGCSVTLKVETLNPVRSFKGAAGHAARDARGGRASIVSANRVEALALASPLLEQLPEPYREALALTEVDGLRQAAAASRLGLSPCGMKSRVQRARAHLRDLLLACCEVELDRRRGTAGYRPRGASCRC
jgi:DNA-directed RNA polymerase specialized sigma24 family protein